MKKRNVEIYPDIPAIGDRLAEFLSEADLRKITFVLSGGNTPRMIFRHLGENHTSLNWKNMDFYWGDERCVPPNHPESNYLMAKKNLFDLIRPRTAGIHRIRGEARPEYEISRYRKDIMDHVAIKDQNPVFDIIMLGVGDDGHTASIFPDQFSLLYSKNVCELAVHPQTRQQRITLTGPVIQMARNILFVVTGKNKAAIISRILKNGQGCESLPAYRIEPENGQLFWLLDKDASSEL
jgi:6-phosphogluconolactonase